ncbi:hypothetical protein PMZ80_005815 [Knufia obscura]|uniref:LAA1-like C-terminal TPR repeats domain-containing protein n=1 Tax=Knufia obscura TaxID=1635080 RepID=A0ABR0RMN1_9EURO|nr:hypothetical protein PMZ80_005815 [Knufia obscura]
MADPHDQQDGPSNEVLEVPPPSLDVSKLHSLPTEQQDLFLLTYVAELRQYTKGLTSQQLPGKQAAIKKEVITIVGLPAPTPSRIIRYNLGQILADTYARGSRQLLVENINELLSFINAGKGEKDIGPRHTATTCLGHVYKSAGDSAISLHGLVLSSLLKSLKSLQSHTGLRASVFRALAQCVEGLGSSLDETVARDVWKQVRTAATTDKSPLVQKHCCACIAVLFKHTPYFLNSNDFESLKNVVWKVLESSVEVTRSAACRTLAQALLCVYSEAKPNDQVPQIRKPKKSSKKTAAVDDEDEVERPEIAPSTRSTVHLSMTLTDILKTISAQYVKPATTNKARSALGTCYKAVLEGLPEKVVQEKYNDIADHFFYDVLSYASISSNRVRLLLSRKIVNDVLSNLIATQLLTENGQIHAARWLINDVLKNYPQVLQGRREPSKHALTAALRALSILLSRLGPAATVFQDSCREALFQVAKHPSYTVQVHAASCFRTFVTACPAQLARTLDGAMVQLKKELEQVDGKLFKRASVYGLAVAAMLRSARDSPLSGSIDSFSKIFAYATELLKASATSELRLCAAQVQIAWTLLGGLMTLGPNFVKVHINQLLLLWRNALPAPLTSDNTSRRSQLELSFLTHVREAALAALSAFLEYNSNLVTSDGSRRISTMLQNSIAFADGLPTTRQTEDLANRLFSSLQLHDHAVNLRRRILQCTIKIMGLKQVDKNEFVSMSDTVGMSIRLFSDPAQPIQRSVEATLASSASSFEGIWELSDNWAFGVNSMIDKFEIGLPANGRLAKIGLQDPAIEPLEASLIQAASAPLVPALENDSTAIYCDEANLDQDGSCSPESTCVTLAVQLFSVALPSQPPRIQESCLEQVATVLAQPLQREPGRKFALQVNAMTAILGALAVANNETGFHAGKLAASTINKSLAEIVRRGILDHDAVMRSISTQALGRLCYLGGSQFTNTEVKNLIDVIVANREPHVRAGCALALGTIHSQVGAMAASYHLKSIIGVLLSLCSDAHPTVHYWALKGLTEVAESAGLSFSAYASSTLGLLAQLYSSDNHNEEALSSSTSTAEMEFVTPVVIGQCVDSVINVLGPDLQDVAKARNLILSLVQYFAAEDIAALQLQSYICLGHISLYAPAHVQMASYVHGLQTALTSGQPLLEEIAISGLENLIKRNATEVFLVARKGLADELWAKFDRNPSHAGLKNTLRSWMQQTCLDETLFWIEQCQSILSRTRKKVEAKPAVTTTQPKTAVTDLADEDVAGLTAAVAAAEGEKPEQAAEGQEYMRWQVRDFAMSLLSDMLDIIRNAMLADHVIAAEHILQGRVAEVVRVAFLASTAVVVELRIRGLHIFDQILKMFGRTPDPDFLEASLLEQYQAQISSALTPAFAADSNAELAAEAISVCATFVATGIVTNVDRMGRIFKVLSAGLDNLASDKPDNSIGDLKDLSWNGQSMLKMSLLSGWAQLQLASTEQTYLEDIVHPYVPKLAPLWLKSLQEFASLRFEPEISDTIGEYVSNLPHERYSALDREVRLVFYQKSWLSIVDAIALLVEKDSNAVFDALDNKQISTDEPKVNGNGPAGKDMNFREEPLAFFFILFGLAYEALVTQARDNQTHALAILGALKRILTPAVSGNAVYQDAVFDETTDTLDRLALTSTSEIQGVLVQIARNLSLDHIIAKSQGRDDKLSEDVDQLFELTRIVILVLAGLVPTLEDPPSQPARQLSEENINLVQMSFQALVDVADVFPSIIRADLYACIMHCYCTMLATGVCQHEVIPRAMPIFRIFLQQMVKSGTSTSESATNSRLVLGALSRMLSTLTIAQRRENDFSIICAKNTLLSLTIVLTTASPAIPPTDKLITKIISEVLDTLQDVGLAKISAGCVRSLLNSSKTPCDQAIARMLWPHILQYVMDADAEDPEIVKTSLMHSLVASVSNLPNATARSAAMSLLVPCLLTRATHPVPNGSKEDLSKNSSARLLELAGVDGAAFRSAIGQLESEQRTHLETLLRSAGLGRKQSAHRRTDTGVTLSDDEESKPAIALRMDF